MDSYNNRLANEMRPYAYRTHSDFFEDYWGRKAVDRLKHRAPYNLIWAVRVSNMLESKYTNESARHF